MGSLSPAPPARPGFVPNAVQVGGHGTSFGNRRIGRPDWS